MGQILHRDAVGGGFTYTVDSFTASGTWTKPANLDYVYVLVIAGGAGGRSGRRGDVSTNRGGGAGLSSSFLLMKFQASDLNSTESIVIGAGGTGGAAQTADNTNGNVGGTGGASYFKSSTFAQVGTTSGGQGGGTAVVTSLSATQANVVSASPSAPLLASSTLTALGTTAASDATRAHSIGNNYLWRSLASAGGNISNTNVQSNSGTITGWYDHTYTLTGEQSGVGEGVNGGTPTSGYTIGLFLNRYFEWLDAADITSEMPRGGIGGGPGNTAGSVAGGTGGNGRGYGAAGGGGGASTNGANSGAGGNGTGGIVIVINVFL